MALHESDRDDILREATALRIRAELLIPGESEPVIVGFRTGGAASVYFGADPAYQFNSSSELRRAYVGGLLYKSEKGRLIELKRVRAADAVHLLRRELTLDQQTEFLAAVRCRLQGLADAIDSSSWDVMEQIPADADIQNLIVAWLAAVGPQLRIADTSHAR